MTPPASGRPSWTLGLLLAATAVLMLMAAPRVSAVEPETCFSRQHQSAIVNVRLALTRPGAAMDSRVVRSERDCVLACCSKEVKPGAKCNMAVFNANKQASENNCFLFHCQTEQDCPLMKAQEGINTYDIYKGLIHPTTIRPVTTVAAAATTTTTTPALPTPPNHNHNHTSHNHYNHTEYNNTEACHSDHHQNHNTNHHNHQNHNTNHQNHNTDHHNHHNTNHHNHHTAYNNTEAYHSDDHKANHNNTSTHHHHSHNASSDLSANNNNNNNHTNNQTNNNANNHDNHTNNQTNNHTDNHTNDHTDNHTNNHTDNHTNNHTDNHTNNQTNNHTNNHHNHKEASSELHDITSCCGGEKRGAVQSDHALQNPSTTHSKAVAGHGALKSGVVAFMVLGLVVLTLALAVGGRKAMESFDRRHYTRLELNDLHYEV
ncbi:MANSC domain-containing protein 1 [Scomber scombrus]|uniref:MANSC domain-containing protein 1 n=1 Tax=Scomber scombrus TaxID=13677 RepID=A0AAV1QEM0_SCOSC